MGGYAVYVWAAYGMTVVVIALNAWAAQRRLRRTLGELKTTAQPEDPARRPTVRKV